MIQLPKKIYLLPTVLFISSFLHLSAQNNTISPYSKLGLGEITGLGFGRNAAMGGTGIALRSNLGLNNINPASLTSLDSLTVFLELGLHGDYTQLTTSSQSGAKSNANFSYLAMGFALTKKWAMSFGISPYSNVGYNTQINVQVNGSTNYYTNTIEGSGGLSIAYLSNAFKIGKYTSVGVTTSVLFGPKKETQYVVMPDIDAFYIKKEESFKYSGFKIDIGLQQVIPLPAQSNLVVGVKANAPGYLYSKYDVLETKVYTATGGVSTLQDEEDVLKKVFFPTNLSAGVAYNYKSTVLFAFDYCFDQSSQYTLNDSYSDYVDNQIFGFGLEVRPKVKGFAQSFIYRAGLNYQTGYLKIDNYTLSSLGLTGGFSFQIRAIRYNIFAEHNMRGTTNYGLIKEQFTRVGINFSLMDIWFQKRKFN